MKLSITTLSDTLFGTAGGGALIDSTTQHHPNGLPFIPAKTLKGLLKESAMEVLEMLGTKKVRNNELLNGLFGQEGTTENGQEETGGEGALSITSAEVEEANSLLNNLQIEEYDISPDEVLDYFTSIRYQTQIDDETGTAKEGSLHSSRVLKPGNVFHVDIDDLSEAQQALLYLACLNLRRVGTNRNRGMGKVEVRFKPSEFDPERAIKLVKEYEKDNDKEPQVSKEEAPDELGSGNIETRAYLITLETPVLLPKSDVNRNTVSSEQYISGRKILGMLASAYIRRYWKKKKKYPEDSFKELFLDGSVIYGPAFICENDEVYYPLGHHWVKTKTGNEVRNDYEEEDQSENTKKIGGRYSIEGNKAPGIRTLLDFHNSRNKTRDTRLMGRNEGDGIFYYESLAPRQQFRTRIRGNSDSLDLLENLMDDPLRLGKSSNTQYGRVKMGPPSADHDEKSRIPETISDEKEVYLTFTSPVLLKNPATLEYDPSLDQLIDAMGVDDIPAGDARIRRESVVVYQGKIHMQLPEALAIAPGSSVKVSASREKIMEWLTNGIGERTHEGYGRCIVETKEDLSKREDDNKRAKIKEQVQRDANKEEQENDKKQNRLKELKSGDFKDHPFVRHLIYRERLANVQSEAMKNANPNQVDHKNTINTVIRFWKEVLMESGTGKDIELKSKLGSFQNDLPKKIEEKLEKMFGSSESISEGFLNVPDLKKGDDPRLFAEYWLRYFDVCKWKNRKSDEQ